MSRHVVRLEMPIHTAFGGAGGIVEGTVSFDAQHTRAAVPYGSTARFENGRFRATIQPPR